VIQPEKRLAALKLRMRLPFRSSATAASHYTLRATYALRAVEWL